MLPLLRRYRVLLLHLSFWAVYFSFYFYQLGQEYGWRQALLLTAAPLLCNALVAYANYCFLLPRFLAHHQLGRYLLPLGAAVALATVGKVVVGRYVATAAMPPAYLFSVSYVVATFLGTLFVVLFVAMLYFAVGWFALEAKTKALENARLTTELQFLKAQINPHFLFNTLNNLYYLAYTQSPNTPEVVATLAQMMRYLLEESNQAIVPLDREIAYMRSYIRLEQLRLNHPVPITFVVEGEPAGVYIAPLLLMTFLENAFKHGVRNHDPNAWVRVHLRVASTGCEYTVSNGRPPTSEPARQPGTGLHNARRRLALSYPDRHLLHFTESSDRYHIHLTLHFA